MARAVDPEARIAYVDNDPVVAAHSRALLGSTPGVTFAVGDVRDPASLLADPEITGLLDFSQPVCVLLLAILHFVTDAEEPARLVAAIRDALAPGSYLILSHGTAHGAPPQVAARSGEASRVYDNATSRITYRDPAQVSLFLDGFSLAEPGLVHISQWRPPVPVPYEFDGFLAAVGRKD